MDPFVVVRLDGAALLWMACALDGAVAPELHRVLQELLDIGARPLVVDLVEVSAIDDGAIAVLAAGAARAAQLGAGLELRLRGGHAVRIRDAAELRSVLVRVYPTAA
jgi:anti-anti-sigma regulatory factor